MNSDENSSCDNCEYEDRPEHDNPCDLCTGGSQWMNKNDDKKLEKSCENCKDSDLDLDNEPCRHCNKYDKWIYSGCEAENINKNEEEIHRFK